MMFHITPRPHKAPYLRIKHNIVLRNFIFVEQENMATLTDPKIQKEQITTLRWLLPVIILAAFVIRMVVVCFVYRDLP